MKIHPSDISYDTHARIETFTNTASLEIVEKVEKQNFRTLAINTCEETTIIMFRPEKSVSKN